MDRRNFLRNGTLASFGIPAILSSAHINPEEQPDNIKNKKGINDHNDLEEATITDLQRKMKEGTLSSASITRWYIDRIQQMDKDGPSLNSIIEMNPDALKIAEERDAERKKGKMRSMLHGIPVLIKDNIDSGDKMMTTAGSLALVGNIASKDAFIIGKLREAGAVLLGKTNLSEFANFRSTHSCSGWSSRGGQTKNPYILQRNPSGSSAGSGSAASANLCTLAIGTETDGSIVSPSSVNGLVGIKPTVGLWSRSGIIPISFTQDSAGPMARTVTDAVILLSHLTGIDPDDEATLRSKGKTNADYTRFLNKSGLIGKRIGIEKSFLTEGVKGGNPEVVTLLKETMKTLQENGAQLIEVDLLKNINPLQDAEFTMLQYEFKEGINKYLASANAPVKSLSQIIEFNTKHHEKAMPYFQQDILISSNEKGSLDNHEYKKAWDKSTSARQILDNMLQQNNLDAIGGVTNGLACCID
ncbi:MAG: amidase family protein, partial [Chitinophagaceae bacterium]